MDTKLNLLKPMVMRGTGKSARLLGVLNGSRPSGRTHVFAVEDGTGNERLYTRRSNGLVRNCNTPCSIDIINVPPVPEYRFRNVYSDRRGGAIYVSVDKAIAARAKSFNSICVLMETLIDGDRTDVTVAHVYPQG